MMRAEVAKRNEKNEELREKLGADYLRKYYNLIKNHGKDCVSEEWNTSLLFLEWLETHAEEIPYGARIYRRDESAPFSPDNCCFFAGGKKVEKKYKTPEPLRMMRKKNKQIEERTGVNYLNRYNSLCARGVIDAAVWPADAYLSWIEELYEKGELNENMHMHKVDQAAPYSSENAYFSLRREGKKSHGMSYTKIYHKYQFWKRYYNSRLEKNYTFEQFLEHAIEQQYHLHQDVCTKAEADEKVKLEDVSFVDNEFYDDINRICAVYRTQIRDNEDEFGGLMAFIEWSIRSGYTSDKDFKKVLPGSYSPKTCVWDIFTEEHYASHYEKIKSACENGTIYAASDLAFRKRANLKVRGELCPEWNDLEVFRKWWNENSFPNCVVKRIDEAKPFSPDNVKFLNRRYDFRNPFYARHKNMKKEGICKEWEDFAAFSEWCAHVGLKKGQMIKRLNTSCPYGPDNVMVVDNQADPRSSDPIYRRWLRFKNSKKSGLADEWLDFEKFDHWCRENDIQKNTRMVRIDSRLPYSPNNVRIA